MQPHGSASKGLAGKPNSAAQVADPGSKLQIPRPVVSPEMQPYGIPYGIQDP